MASNYKGAKLLKLVKFARLKYFDMIQIGDKVKFLNDVGGGVVKSFVSKNIVNVENYDGFEIPVLISEVVKVDERAVYEPKSTTPSNFFATTEKTAKPVVVQQKETYKPVIIKGNDNPKFFIAFYPTDQKNPVGGEIEIHLVNDSNFSLLYHFSYITSTGYKTIDSGELEPNTKAFLEGLAQTDLNDLPQFGFRIIPFLKEGKSLQAPLVKDIRINPIKFYKEKSYTENDFFNGKAMMVSLVAPNMEESIDNLSDDDFQKIVDQKDAENRAVDAEIVKPLVSDTIEVDLHINELVDDSKGLSNHEMLEIQLEKFTSELEKAIKNGVRRIVFIHGVGNGKLKLEVHNKLKLKYAKYYFQDASFKEYGYGATMVILRRK